MKFPFFGRCHVVAACFFVTCVVVFCCHAQDSQSYDEWSLLEFGERTGTSEALPLGDFNGDGVKNFVAYAIGISGSDESFGFVPQIGLETIGTSRALVCTYFVSRGAVDIGAKLEVSQDMVVWGDPEALVEKALDSELSGADKFRFVLPDGDQTFVRVIYNFGGAFEILIPSLVDLSIQSAVDLLESSGLEVGEFDRVPTNQILPSVVLSQDPAAGGLLSSGSRVGLQVSQPLDPDRFIDVYGDVVPEDEQTALAYYKAIDPNDAKLTLWEWLRANGVDAPEGAVDGPGQTGAIRAETVYFNDGDLGFGRHMYMHVGTDVYSNPSLIYWVTNHGNVDDAWEKFDAPLATVAMEYSTRPDGQGEPFVKFYTYGPDGSRITKIDLDGRGEKYQPGMCSTCHGGRPQALVFGNYPNDGDIGTQFLPFDLDTFTYSEVNSEYTRDIQEAEFKVLNEWIMYHNFDYEEGGSGSC